MQLRRAVRMAVVLAVIGAGALARGDDDGGGGDLDAVQRRGVLRHLGIPYANFVTGSGDGFDVELARLFASHLKVRYAFVQTDWPAVLPDLVGRRVSARATELTAAAPAPIRGDLVASGLTILPWRQRVAAFSTPVFPTQVWVVARSDSELSPIRPSGVMEKDIAAVKALLAGRTVLGVAATCLDPALYHLEETRARLILRQVRLDEVAPLLVNREGELALLDVADAMIALQRWPGRLKVIGPVSAPQEMGVAFRTDAPRLRAEFERFLAAAKRDGTYQQLVHRYFPEAPVHFPAFFADAGPR